MNVKEIELKNVLYKYPDGKTALEEISFCISSGESVGIIGANGAGKSTLLLLLMGIIYPTKGDIIIKGVQVNKKNILSVRQNLGLVFQNPDDQLFMSKVYDDVAFGPRNMGLSEKDIEDRTIKSLEYLGILHLKDRAPFNISGGEKKLVSIATVLSMHPDILIMDEPTSSLDPKARRKVINILNTINKTKIITSHDLDMVLETCTRVILLKEGKIVKNGDTDEILRDTDTLENSGLEEPLSFRNCPFCKNKK